MIPDLLLLMLAGFIAGAMNSAAGGGSFVSFPALVFAGVPSVAANASSTVALFPGAVTGSWAYRNDFQSFEGISVRTLLPVSVAGGLSGALLLLFTPVHTFDVIVPWLLLLGTTAFAFGPRLAHMLKQVVRLGPVSLVAAQFVLGIYGGYFGGAVGLMTLATWSLFGANDIRAMNAAKTLLVGSMNSIAVVAFIIAGKVYWTEAAVMAIAAAIGGYAGARIARRVERQRIRLFINCVNVTMTIIFFVRAFG